MRGKFHVDFDIDGIKGVFKVSGRLHWNAFCILSAFIKRELEKNKTSSLIIDLIRLDGADQDGVLPLIALLDRYREAGLPVVVRMPRAHELRAIFNNHNWSHYLDKSHKKIQRQNTRSTGVLEFNDFSSLNNIINKAMHIAIKGGTFKNGALQSLEWSLNEITDNVVRHSGNSHGWFEVTWQADGSIKFTVCDNGVGIPATMRAAFPELSDDADAIHRSVEKGVTSNSEGQGNGLAGTLEITHQCDGLLIINSYKGHLHSLKGRVKSEPACVPYMGTFVHFSMPDDVEIDLTKAIWGYESLGYAQLKYDMNESDDVVIRLREEESNFGNRPTGLRVRNLIQNTVTQFEGRRIVIDFNEVGLISSSFADEVFGKLALSWGILNFTRILKIINATNLVENIINKAIMQRMAQSFSSMQSGATQMEGIDSPDF
ncbi:DUF4325 domain-containing protein [Deinococcus sp. YIM 134068]|uniref:STAS-like domain-containing protein n=1 Tax=Deinococcus lichenicola TaxID=3118910 RepID=UPI002F949A8A